MRVVGVLMARQFDRVNGRGQHKVAVVCRSIALKNFRQGDAWFGHQIPFVVVLEPKHFFALTAISNVNPEQFVGWQVMHWNFNSLDLMSVCCIRTQNRLL